LQFAFFIKIYRNIFASIVDSTNISNPFLFFLQIRFLIRNLKTFGTPLLHVYRKFALNTLLTCYSIIRYSHELLRDGRLFLMSILSHFILVSFDQRFTLSRNVISRSLATLLPHGFGLSPGRTAESHSEILANRSLFSRNIYLPFMSLTSGRRFVRFACTVSILVRLVHPSNLGRAVVSHFHPQVLASSTEISSFSSSRLSYMG